MSARSADRAGQRRITDHDDLMLHDNVEEPSDINRP
jgi:hypothetical protein